MTIRTYAPQKNPEIRRKKTPLTPKFEADWSKVFPMVGKKYFESKKENTWIMELAAKKLKDPGSAHSNWFDVFYYTCLAIGQKNIPADCEDLYGFVVNHPEWENVRTKRKEHYTKKRELRRASLPPESSPSQQSDPHTQSPSTETQSRPS